MAIERETKHKELATSVVIPYLLNIPDIYNLAQYSGQRYQYIEDVLWKLLYYTDLNTAEGVWLDYIGTKVGQERVYAPTPEGAFTFGGTQDEGFGAGHFGTYGKDVLDDNTYRQAIRAKIIQNFTNASIPELKKSCKLLFNAKKVVIEEGFPANLNYLRLYGRNLIEMQYSANIVKQMIACGVSIGHVYFYKVFNLFKNDAFIQYNQQFDESHDFEINLIFIPDTIPTEKDIAILSVANSFGQPNGSNLVVAYNSNDGIYLKTCPARYTNQIGQYYVNQDNEFYYNADYSLFLKYLHVDYTDENGAIYKDELGQDYTDEEFSPEPAPAIALPRLNDKNSLRITKVGDTWSLYLNNNLIAKKQKKNAFIFSSTNKIFLGNADDNYYNAGSIYSFIIKDNTENKIILNDSLKGSTIGINNGVEFF